MGTIAPVVIRDQTGRSKFDHRNSVGEGQELLTRVKRMRRQYRAIFWQFMFVCTLVLFLTIGQLGLSVSPVAAASCTTSSPSSGAYLVTVCLSQPVSGALVSGKVTVTASVTTNGAAPGMQRVIYTLDGSCSVLTEFYTLYFFIPTRDNAVGG